MVEKLFKLKENGTNVKTEIAAGITTFMTMAYILAINPSILSSTGMDSTAVLLATCLASFIGTVCMAFMANLPFALSAGMGLNAYMAYTVCGSDNLGYSWQVALLAVFIEGIIFIILSLTKVREAIFDAIPLSLKRAVSVGIGLFIAFIGLQNAGLAVSSSTLVKLTNFRENFNTTGICALLAVIGLLIMAVLYIKRVKGAILIGIFVTWILGILCEITGLYIPDADNGVFSLIPSFKMTDFSSISKTFGQCFNVDMNAVGIFNFAVVVFSFLFVDLFDTLGTLIGVSTKAGLLDKNGKLPAIKPALMADAVATTAGAVLGTSTTTTFVESSAGAAAGGKTGLTALTTAVLFLFSMLLAPIFISIPAFATAPALILVGFLMFSTVSEIKVDEKNYTSAIPAYLCVIAMPLFYSISEGISIGVISYVVINLACKKYKEINPIMYILAVLFVLKYIFL
ncbi:NCS2 family permease [Ruminococcus flavefaciens]|uniref:Putative MFS transporter, AGZA family, xanthine/uracil permease n=1 Tax=Ruminococcus flavefaciens TaxID=1265 RepID=A0A1M7IM53_RUMFL|nr:NCS2 family permease [Ruminococcus flavefaciens]SHM41810.1 putative MFS transporter, AGZA family, xanthine/uracil permease [Ruminococcus flavefaciens]